MTESMSTQRKPDHVWLCSGQSNMAMSVAKCAERDELLQNAANSQVWVLRGQDWCQPTAEQIDRMSAVAWSFALEMAKLTKRSQGVIVSARGGTRIHSWLSRQALQSTAVGQMLLDLTASEEVKEAARQDREAFRPYDQTRLSTWGLGRALPSELYDALIEPVIAIPITGVLWYQGESDADTAETARDYAAQLQCLIESYRHAWGRPSLPFVVIELPDYGMDDETRENWMLLRQAQNQAVKRTPGAEIVHIRDLGDAEDIHPRRKRDVGKRAAAQAYTLIETADEVAR